MQNSQKKTKSMSGHGFSQFELTTNLLKNLNKFKLTPTAKLVLMFLSSCYNPKHGEMFPKQKTIADKLGVSEASVIRAVCELHKEGLIISERKYTNRYVFTSRFLISLGISDEKMQVETSQNEMKETCKMIGHDIEQTKRTNKPTNVDDFKILKEYAVKHNAKNVNAYISFLKKSGSDKQIIADYKRARANNKAMLESAKRTKESLELARKEAQMFPVEKGFFEKVKKQLMFME